MSWFNNASPRSIGLAMAIAAMGAGAGACSEQLDSGMACPALCPEPPAIVRDTTFFAITIDSSVAGFPSIGNDTVLFVASMGDTLQTRGIVRFDTLPRTFRHANSVVDSAIVEVDSGAVIRLRLAVNDTLAPSTTVEIYDVGLQGAEDADPTVVASAFTPDRLIGSGTFDTGTLEDSIRVPIDPDRLLARIQEPAPYNRLRIGIRVSSPSGSATLSVQTANLNGHALLIFRPSRDSTVPEVQIAARSMTPDEPIIAADLADYLVVTTAPPDPPPDVLRVGGMTGRRVYLGFDIPPEILDSSSVVRATLLLTQRPDAFAPAAGDSVTIRQFAIVASRSITDVGRALRFLGLTTLEAVRLLPADSGVHSFEMIAAVRAWRGTDSLQTPRAIALRTATEGALAAQADFYSMEAPLDVRPRLRITYLTRREAGLP